MTATMNHAALRRDLAAAQAKLSGLKTRVQKKALRAAAGAAARVLRDAARGAVPVRNGYLKRSTISVVRTRGTAVIGLVGQDLSKLRSGATKARRRQKGGGISGRGETVPSHLVDQAVKAHRIAVRHRQAMAFGDRFAAAVRHPGHRGANYLARSAAAARSPAQRAAELRIIAEADKT